MPAESLTVSGPPVDAAAALMARDEVSGSWEEEDPDVAKPPGFSARPACSAFAGRVFDVAADGQAVDAAAAGWFDPRSRTVLNSDQVVRVYPDVSQAKTAVAQVRSMVRECGTWREGNEKPGSWVYSTQVWQEPGLVRAASEADEVFGWRVQAGFAAFEGAEASTWYVTARYGHVVTTVGATALDDGAARGQQDALDYVGLANDAVLTALPNWPY